MHRTGEAASVLCLRVQQEVHSISATLLQHTASHWRLSTSVAQDRTVCVRASGCTLCALAAHRAGLVASGVLWEQSHTRQRRRYASRGGEDCWTRCGGAGRGYAAPLLAALSAGSAAGHMVAAGCAAAAAAGGSTGADMQRQEREHALDGRGVGAGGLLYLPHQVRSKPRAVWKA